MSNRLFATAGSKVFISVAKTFTGDDFVAADFTTDNPVYTEIKGVTNMGVFGDGAELITSDEIGLGRTRKAKGVRNAGSMQLVADLDYADAGQLALIAAEKTDATYAFKVQFDDAPAGGTPSVRYFTALVLSAAEALNQANSVMALNTTLEIDSNIVSVAADEA